MLHPFLKSLFVFLCIFFGHFSVFATHIIGGDISVIWTGSGTQYQIVLSKYLNENSVIQHGLTTENIEHVYIYEKGTDILAAIQPLNLMLNNHITSNSNFCVNTASVNTSLLIYTGLIDLSSLDPVSSYYVTWEECCRNQAITNISDPIDELIVLYTEFPGINIINSSPLFKPLQNEFFCRNDLNTFNMSAIDADRDSLVYSLVSPRKLQNPFVDVDWYNGYSGTSPIPGSVPLRIDPKTGILTFNPSRLGVFLFGIKVEEYRGKTKIGEVRKDYQFTVQDCPFNNKPVVGLKPNAFIQNDTLIVKLKENRCFLLYITDIDASKYGITEKIYIKHTSSFPAAGLVLPADVTISRDRDSAFFNVCLNPCAYVVIDKTTFYSSQIVINDDRCPAQYDTLNFVIKVEAPANEPPKIFVDPPTLHKYVLVDSLLTFNVYGTDSDQADLLSLVMLNAQRSMQFKNVFDSSSTISSTFKWRPTCADIHPGTYDVYFVIKDNSCLKNHEAIAYQQITVLDDKTSFDHVLPTNLITPNGDGKNDYYEIQNIPIGNCSMYFKNIEIYNRWGARIFFSEDRFFKWYPDVSDGIYYYSLDLNQTVKKGWIEVIR